MDDGFQFAFQFSLGFVMIQLVAISWGIGSLTNAVKEIVVELKKGNNK